VLSGLREVSGWPWRKQDVELDRPLEQDGVRHVAGLDQTELLEDGVARMPGGAGLGTQSVVPDRISAEAAIGPEEPARVDA